jgi:hypothetical protein
MGETAAAQFLIEYGITPKLSRFELREKPSPPEFIQ